VHHLAWPRYLAIQLASLSLWGAILTTLGYILSNHAETLVGEIKSAEKWLFLAFVISTVLFLMGRHIARRLLARSGGKH
jgi:membrane protein DedA with SNARE-associated domain